MNSAVIGNVTSACADNTYFPNAATRAIIPVRNVCANAPQPAPAVPCVGVAISGLEVAHTVVTQSTPAHQARISDRIAGELVAAVDTPCLIARTHIVGKVMRVDVRQQRGEGIGDLAILGERGELAEDGNRFGVHPSPGIIAILAHQPGLRIRVGVLDEGLLLELTQVRMHQRNVVKRRAIDRITQVLEGSGSRGRIALLS